MGGLGFLFASALLALPLAALPVLLHLLFRRKSPVVPFSTLRFVKASLQRTAARRRLQRWLLLAARMLLLALLIAAAAQPVRRVAADWGSGGEITAVIVLDTSFSMLLRQDQVEQLTRAGDAVYDLLGRELADARVAILRGKPDPTTERFRPASAWLSDWTPPLPQPSPLPLVDRINAAIALLEREPAGMKWLIVCTDGQAREFPRPLLNLPGIRVLWLDLRPATPRSAGIVGVKIDPPRPIAGVGVDAVVELSGRVGDSRAVSVSLRRPDGAPLYESPTQVARFGESGRASVRFAVTLGSERWQVLRASLAAEDELAWDNQRDLLVEIPPRQPTHFEEVADLRQASRFVRLALDPSEGRSSSWPIELRTTPRGDERAVVRIWTDWPVEATLRSLRDFAREGGVVVLMLRPGIELGFRSLDEARKQLLLELLPSTPTDEPGDRSHRLVASLGGGDLLGDLLDAQFDPGSVIVRRFVPFAPGGIARPLLSITPVTPWPGAGASMLLGVRPVGSGRVHTLSTVPDPRFTNLATHPLFLPMLVRLVMVAPDAGAAQNVEIGEAVGLGPGAPRQAVELTLQGPGGQLQVVRRSPTGQFELPGGEEVGLYRWRDHGEVVGMSNVAYPSGEAELAYRRTSELLPVDANAIVGSSLDELRASMATRNQPLPRWSSLVAVVLALLCVESLLASRR